MQTSKHKDPNWDEVCRCAEAGFDWCLAKAKQSRSQGQVDSALGWLSVAAWSAGGCGFSGRVASPELEQELARCAEGLGSGGFQGRSGGRKRWLHVFDEAYVVGGHTALCWRWIEARTATERHSVLLIRQRGRVPEKLRLAAEASGGRIHVLDPGVRLVEQARQLCSAAREQADVVVLHTHPDSVVPTVAFGAPGGPPVVVVNHADHLFQTTGAIADLLFDIRDSGAQWTRNCRGITVAAIVPVPLSDPLEAKTQESALQDQAFRERLGLPRDSVVLLTVGSAFKYTPVKGLSFCAAVEPILQAHPSVWLVAIGPEDDGEWRRLRKTTGGRVLALGRQEDLVPFHRTADIYLEGFPMGSLTAMLEAGLAGLPCVRAPREVPPPFCSDGIAFEANPEPASLRDYGAQIAELIRNPLERERQGRLMRDSVRRHHCGEGWAKYLEEGIAKVPAIHQVNLARRVASVSLNQRDYWLSRIHVTLGRPGGEDIGAAILGEAVTRGLPVQAADYSSLGAVLQPEAGPPLAAAMRAHTLPSEGTSGHGSRSRILAQRLEQNMRRDLRRRRLLRWWEIGKQRVLQPLGIVGLVRRFGRSIVGDLRH